MEPILEIKQATTYIKRMYNRICKKKPLLKYHKGSIKYLFLEHWCYNEATVRHPSDLDNMQTLCKIVKKAMAKFPSAAQAISEDIKELIPIHTRSSPELCWMSGYLEGATEGLAPHEFTVLEIPELELRESDFESQEFLKAKLESIIDEAQELLDDLEVEEDEDDDE